MFQNQPKMSSVQVANLLAMNSFFPQEILQVVPANVVVLKNTIGNSEFDFLLKDLSEASRRGTEISSLWTSRVGVGNSATDAESMQAIASLAELVKNARVTLYENYFPYDITRTPSPAVVCYRKLPQMQMAEYAAQLIDPTYSRPGYFLDAVDQMPYSDLFDSLGGVDGPLSKLLASKY